MTQFSKYVQLLLRFFLGPSAKFEILLFLKDLVSFVRTIFFSWLAFKLSKLSLTAHKDKSKINYKSFEKTWITKYLVKRSTSYSHHKFKAFCRLCFLFPWFPLRLHFFDNLNQPFSMHLAKLLAFFSRLKSWVNVFWKLVDRWFKEQFWSKFQKCMYCLALKAFR